MNNDDERGNNYCKGETYVCRKEERDYKLSSGLRLRLDCTILPILSCNVSEVKSCVARDESKDNLAKTPTTFWLVSGETFHVDNFHVALKVC